MKQRLNYSAAKGTPQKRGCKRWLSMELTFKVDAKKIIKFPDGKISNLIPLKKGRKKIPYRVLHCDREGNVLTRVA